MLLAVTLLFFSGLFSGKTYSDVSRFQRVVYPWGDPGAAMSSPRVIHYDQAKSYYPWQVFINRSLRSGEVPLWDPYAFAGTPFLAANANNALYPPRVALALVASPARVHDLFVLLHMFAAGLTMYLLLAYLRVTFAAALLGAIAWMASSFMLAWLALEHFTVVAALLPLALLLVDLSVRRRSWAATLALGLVLALLFLGGNLLFVELCSVGLAAYGASVVVGRAASAARRRELRRRSRELVGDLILLAAPWLVLVGLAAVTLFPTLDLVRSAARAPLSYPELREYRLPASELANLFIAPDVEEVSFLRDPYHSALFAGTAVTLLAIVGLTARRRMAWFARVVALAAVLVALGTPLLALPYWVLPGFDNFKPLGRVLFLYAFALAILAAFGLDTISRWLRRRTSSRWRAVAVCVAVGAITATVIQLRLYESDVLHTQNPAAADLYPATPLVERLEAAGPARIFPSGGVLPGSTPLVYELRSGGGYESLVPRRVEDFWRVVTGVSPQQVAREPLHSAFEPITPLGDLRLDLLRSAGVSYVVAPPGTQAPASGLALDYDGSDGRIFRVLDALPRAYLVGRCEEAADASSALVRFQQSDFDARTTVLLERNELRRADVSCGRSSTGAAGWAKIVGEQLNSVTVDVQAPARAFLVLNDSWDPGWHAVVDGRSAPVLAANSVFRAVQVQPGRHVVELRYEPRAYEIGVWTTGMTLLVVAGCLAALGIRPWRFRRRLR